MIHASGRSVLVVPCVLACILAAAFPADRACSQAQTPVSGSQRDALQAKAGAILEARCTTCHGDVSPEQGMTLSRERFAASTVDVPSREIPSLKRVDTAKPEASYLLMKIRGAAGIQGSRMPRIGPPLSADDIGTIERWVQAVSAAGPGTGAVAPGATPRFATPPFYGVTLLDLPTTSALDKGEILLRISHRFLPPVKSNSQNFMGLDGPASVYLSLAYGITDRLSLELGRTNNMDEIALTGRLALLRQGLDFSSPLSVTTLVGVSQSTTRPPDVKLFAKENFHFTLAVPVSRQVSDRFCLLGAFLFAGNTDYGNPLSHNTAAAGVGARFTVVDQISVVGEWIPALDGFETGTDTWGVGIEKKLGGHVFHVFVNDAYGITENQYLPGGDLRNNVRFGFNIYRVL